MLTFAAPQAPLQMRGFHFSDEDLCLGDGQGLVHGRSAARHPAQPAHARYWPCELLDTFTLKMAATGRCVNTAMMLGDRQYARAQLAAARVSRDTDLVALSARLQAYFDAAATEGCIVAAAISQAQDERLLVV